jgi:16S rRNA (guanine527-N7)-methyltransferase
VFDRYAALLLAWSGRFDLTALRTTSGILRLHFVDSLACLIAIGERSGISLIDVGSGAGFPGIPLKIAVPELNVTLVEASRNRVAFLEMLVDRLPIQCQVIRDRAEELGRRSEHRERYGVAVARAVAPLPRLLELVMPLVRVGGRAVLAKGSQVAREVEEAGRMALLLGGAIQDPIPVGIPGLESRRRSLVVVTKERATPQNFPRRRMAAPRPGAAPNP